VDTVWRDDCHTGGSDAIAVLLHIGATTPAGVAAVIVVIFLLIFAMSFAFGPVPAGERHFGKQWVGAWLRASAPRFVIAGVFAGAVLVGALLWGNVGSSSASSCNNPLPPLTGTAVTDARILSGIQALNDMTAAAQAGDRDRVRTLFFTEDAHNLSHDIDRPLRAQDPGLAKQLCLSVIAFENQIAGPVDPSAVETDTKAIAADFQQARGILSASSIVTPAVAGTLDPCSQPLQAITNEPLNAQRLQAAIATMQQAGQLAAAGDEAGAEAAFVGDPHNLTHDIDGPLRGVDRDLALNLCHSIVAIELHLGVKYDTQIMQTEAAKSAGYLQQAGRELGILT
jgi:hypothetical protein